MAILAALEEHVLSCQSKHSKTVLRIRDVYPGSEFFPSRIPNPNLFHPGSASKKNKSILTQKMVSKHLEIWSEFFIPRIRIRNNVQRMGDDDSAHLCGRAGRGEGAGDALLRDQRPHLLRHQRGLRERHPCCPLCQVSILLFPSETSETSKTFKLLL